MTKRDHHISAQMTEEWGWRDLLYRLLRVFDVLRWRSPSSWTIVWFRSGRRVCPLVGSDSVLSGSSLGLTVRPLSSVVLEVSSTFPDDQREYYRTRTEVQPLRSRPSGEWCTRPVHRTEGTETTHETQGNSSGDSSQSHYQTPKSVTYHCRYRLPDSYFVLPLLFLFLMPLWTCGRTLKGSYVSQDIYIEKFTSL